MLKTDVKELRKELKKAPNQDGIIDWVYGFYVDTDNNVVWENLRKYYDYSEEEKFRHYNILSKAVSAGIGKDIFPVQTKQSELVYDILKSNCDEPDTNMQSLRDTVLEQYPHTDPYYATLTHIQYDVPGKASDGAVLEDENSLFETIVFAVCPSKLSAPALGFEDGEVAELSRRWTIGAPACGFMYPSFDDRSANLNEVSLYMKKNNGSEMLHAIFEIEEEVSNAEEQKTAWNTVLSELNMTQESAAILNASICEQEDEFLTKEKLSEIAEESGIDKEKFSEIYDSEIGDKALPVSVIASEKVEVKTDSVKILTDKDKAPFIKTKKIDGIEYLLIPADGVITVNGAEVVLR